jgi:hypothetical protein
MASEPETGPVREAQRAHLVEVLEAFTQQVRNPATRIEVWEQTAHLLRFDEVLATLSVRLTYPVGESELDPHLAAARAASQAMVGKLPGQVTR